MPKRQAECARWMCAVGCKSGYSPTVSSTSDASISRNQQNERPRTQLLDKDLEKMVQRCDTCQLHNKSPPAAPLHPWDWPEKLWTHIHIDYAGPFLGKMLSVVDATSKRVETHIMSSTTSTATVNKLREIFAQHRLPEVLVSDNAANFISEEFATFVRKNGIIHVTSAP